MDFSDALRELKLGNRVTRPGWNGHNMWLCVISASFDDDPKPAYVVTAGERP